MSSSNSLPKYSYDNLHNEDANNIDAPLNSHSVKYYVTPNGDNNNSNGIVMNNDNNNVAIIMKDECDNNKSLANEKESNSDEDFEARPKSERWSNRVEFLLSLIGYAVGFGNVWRFSYYCQRNGGGAFLFPYLIILFVLGIPMLYLELNLGKVTQTGPLKAIYKLVPAFGGVGLAAVITLIYITYYYNLLLAYVFFYLFGSFQLPLAWDKAFCGVNGSASFTNISRASQACYNESSKYFYYATATMVSPSIGEIGQFNWKLWIAIMGSWVIIYICVFNGIKSSGKVVYITATLPYVVLIILFFRAVTLPGASNGLLALFTPEHYSLFYNPQVWLEAGAQIFYSLGLGLGSNILLASHLDQNTNVFGDALFVSLVNSGTSIFASIVVFSILGYQAQIYGTDVHNIVGGPGLIFIAFASALLEMPIGPLWSILFFIMMLSLGLDSQFAGVESVVQSVMELPYLKKLHRAIVTAIVCVLFLIASLIFAFGNGEYIFQLIDQFSGSYSLFIVAFFELIAISWFFGVHRIRSWKTADYTPPTQKYFKGLKNSYKFQMFIKWFWFAMWAIICPAVMVIIFLGSLAYKFVEPITYTRYSNFVELESPYPLWASLLATFIVLSTVLSIPIVFFVKFELSWWNKIGKLFSLFLPKNVTSKLWPNTTSITGRSERSYSVRHNVKDDKATLVLCDNSTSEA